VNHGVYLAVLISLVSLNLSEAANVYQNTFTSPSSLNAFTTYGGGSVSIESGQLRIDPGSSHSRLTLDTSLSFSSAYKPILSQNSGLISWSFNVANQNGGLNNGFSFVLASTMADPYDLGADGYYLHGGGMAGNRMAVTRFDYGLGGGQQTLVDITDGLGPLPQKGSFRITFDPATDTWSLFGETGSEFTDPTQIDTPLGTATDGTYTDVEAKFFGFGGQTTGSDFFDNVNVDVVPEPASSALLVIGAGVLYRYKRNQTRDFASR